MARSPRIAGQPPEEWSEATRQEFAQVIPVPAEGSAPAATGGGAEARTPARPLHLPSVIARHPTLLSPYMTWAKAIALDGVLSRRENALLALRTALHCRSAFEWGVHSETAVRRAGLSPDEVARVAVGADDPRWSSHDAALLRAADDLHVDHVVGDVTWSELSRDHDDAGLIEIVFVVGHYTMLSMLANSVGVEPEPHWRPLPDVDRHGGDPIADTP